MSAMGTMLSGASSAGLASAMDLIGQFQGVIGVVFGIGVAFLVIGGLRKFLSS